MVSEKTSPHVGFSRKRLMRLSESVITTPYWSGFFVRGEHERGGAFFSLWKSQAFHEVDIGQHVARNDHDGLAGQVFVIFGVGGEADATGVPKSTSGRR